MIALRRLSAVAYVELLRLLRAPTSFTLLLLVPALQVLLFGYAIRPDAAQVRVAVSGPVASTVSEVADRLAKTSGLTIVLRSAKPGAAASAVQNHSALIGVEIPAAASATGPQTAQQPVRVTVDATNAGLTNTAVARIEASYWKRQAEQLQIADLDPTPGIAIERLYNPQARADWTFLPALIGVTVMIAMIMLGSLGLARERETGTWEALLGLPISPGQMIVGKLIPPVIIGTVQGVLVLSAGAALFDLPMRGSIAALILLLPLFAAAHAAIGQAIALRAATQLAALQGAVAFYLPAMLLSGFLYPFETLPPWAQTLGSVFPLTHFIRAAHGAVLRGDGAAAVLAHGLPMLALLIVVVGVMLVMRDRRLD